MSCMSSALLFRERVFNNMNIAVVLVGAEAGYVVGATSTQVKGPQIDRMHVWFFVMTSSQSDRASVKQNSGNSMVHVNKLTSGAPMYIARATQEFERFHGIKTIWYDVTEEVQELRGGVFN